MAVNEAKGNSKTIEESLKNGASKITQHGERYPAHLQERVGR